jgi:hypothetical protein
MYLTDAHKDWEARFKASEIRPLSNYIPELIVTCAPIPGPWWIQILASIGILALFGLKNHSARTNPQADARGYNPVP